MTPLPHIALQYEEKDAQGRTWFPYGVEFSSPEGTYECIIYAISDMHAELQLEALKETGRINGQTIATFTEFKE